MQMACAHGAVMMLLDRFEGGVGGDRRVQALAHAMARIMTAFNHSAETLRRRKQGGSQCMRIDHVHVTDGGAGHDRQRAAACGESDHNCD